ncbi:hypothetical protein KRP22_003156 [Phytophthora ramorum]|uniref:uncharacterized protein n=1 Tax=Phytophthora ramorum TaxID=164328 RepID=UPI0030B4A68A|nr:hypothetical protein KRP23_10257 [Phytophthora ramorum]KAH7503759.1 hypothetical protein KRP22_6807 [Phytophthora ramorum]
MESSARPPKRLSSVQHEGATPSKRLQAFRNDVSTPTVGNTLATTPSAMEICAFGLEDRAEAVISRGKESWTLANLSKWRHDSLDKAANATDSQHRASPHSNNSSKEYLRHRQRAYRQQILANREQPKQSNS